MSAASSTVARSKPQYYTVPPGRALLKFRVDTVVVTCSASDEPQGQEIWKGVENAPYHTYTYEIQPACPVKGDGLQYQSPEADW